MGRDEGLDVELAEGLRRGAGADADIMIDAGCCWDAVTALRRARAFEEYDPLWLEEPLRQDDLDGYRWLNERSPVPVAAGEGEAGRHAWRQLYRAGRYPDLPDRPRAHRSHRSDARSPTWPRIAAAGSCNHFYSTGVNLAAGLHFAAARASSFIFEYCVEETPTRSDLTRQQMPIDEDGFVHVPDGPGLGVDLDDDVVDDLRVG